MSTETLQADIAALEAAIASGALRVRFTDREVYYRSLSDMYAILAKLKSLAGLDVGAARRVTRTVTRYWGGFH